MNFITTFFLAAETIPYLKEFTFVCLIIIVLGLVLRYFKQPYIIAYITAGIILGEHGFDIIKNQDVVTHMGEVGLVLLLFFIGMEINLPRLIKIWRIPTFGTLFQIILSLLAVGAIGLHFNWQINRVLVIGFVICFSSSAVVIKLLQDTKEDQTRLGRSVISILIMQDIIFIPVLIFIGFLGGSKPTLENIVLQLFGAGLLIGLIIWMLRKRQYTLPYSESIDKDHEFQVILALAACFGFASLTALFGLSPALGAFVGGLLLHGAKSSTWIHDSLHSFRVVFVALFFISIGLMIDLNFLANNFKIISLILLSVFITNHIINAVIIYFFKKNWKESFYGGALLAQIGELSFVLALSGFQQNVITEYGYQLAVVIISLTLLISPIWIIITKRLTRYN